MTHTQAKDQSQRSFGSKDRMGMDGRWIEAIVLPPHANAVGN